MYPTRYRQHDITEERRQLFWGAFMLGCAAFQGHRSAGFWLDGITLAELALQRFQEISRSPSEDIPHVEDWSSGLACFTGGFVTGYHQRAERIGPAGLRLCHELMAGDPVAS